MTESVHVHAGNMHEHAQLGKDGCHMANVTEHYVIHVSQL